MGQFSPDRSPTRGSLAFRDPGPMQSVVEPFGSIVWVPAGAAALYGEFSVPSGEGSAAVLIVRALGLDEPVEADHEVASQLAEAGFATLIVDLVEPGEREEIERVKGDPGLLANRAIATAWWLLREQSLYDPVLGLVGMPSAAGAALETASNISDLIKGLVVLGGRPDVPSELIRSIEAPTLLVVGEEDPEGIEVYRAILAELQVEKRLDEIPNVGEQLIDDPVELVHVAQHACRWLSRYSRPELRGAHASSVLPSQAEP